MINIFFKFVYYFILIVSLTNVIKQWVKIASVSLPEPIIAVLYKHLSI